MINATSGPHRRGLKPFPSPGTKNLFVFDQFPRSVPPYYVTLSPLHPQTPITSISLQRHFPSSFFPPSFTPKGPYNSHISGWMRRWMDGWGSAAVVFVELLTRTACTLGLYLQVQGTGSLDGEPDAAKDVPRPHDPQELVLRRGLMEQRHLFVHEESVRHPY